MTEEKKWVYNKKLGNYILDDGNGKVFISYQPNDRIRQMWVGTSYSELDSANPETAIVIRNDKPDGEDRFLITRGDHREELEKIYPDINALKKWWSEHGGHFFSDDLKDE